MQKALVFKFFHFSFFVICHDYFDQLCDCLVTFSFRL